MATTVQTQSPNLIVGDRNIDRFSKVLPHIVSPKMQFNKIFQRRLGEIPSHPMRTKIMWKQDLILIIQAFGIKNNNNSSSTNSYHGRLLEVIAAIRTIYLK